MEYSSRITSYLQRGGMSGFTECLIIRCYVISHIHNRLHYKKQVFQSIIWESADKCYTAYSSFNTSGIEIQVLGKNQERGKSLMGGTC